jgi:hypothetical protein
VLTVLLDGLSVKHRWARPCSSRTFADRIVASTRRGPVLPSRRRDY